MYIYVHAEFKNSMRAKVIECTRAARPLWVGRYGYRGYRGADYGNGGGPSCDGMPIECRFMSLNAYPPAPYTLPLPLQSTKAVGTAEVERAQSRGSRQGQDMSLDKTSLSTSTRHLLRHQPHDTYETPST